MQACRRKSAKAVPAKQDNLQAATAAMIKERLANLNDPRLAGLEITSMKMVGAAPGQGAQPLEWKPDQYLELMPTPTGRACWSL